MLLVPVIHRRRLAKADKEILTKKRTRFPFPKLDQQYDKVSIERALATVKILRIERQHIEITIGTVIGQTPGVISKSGFVYM